jgi:hypothetical protein
LSGLCSLSALSARPHDRGRAFDAREEILSERRQQARLESSLLNRYLHLAPKGAEGSIELLKPSCMVQSKQPINRLALPVQASHEFSSGDILSHEKTVKLDL